MQSFDSRMFRNLLGCFATGITIATTRLSDGAAVGVTINSFTSVSLDPPLILFCLAKKSRLLPAFRNGTHFAINILAEDQEDLSRAFATHGWLALTKKSFLPDQIGCPILAGTLGYLVCRKHRLISGGDHWIILGEVQQIKQGRKVKKPLLYFRSAYRKL